jgi:hypothetical protein
MVSNRAFYDYPFFNTQVKWVGAPENVRSTLSSDQLTRTITAA